MPSPSHRVPSSDFSHCRWCPLLSLPLLLRVRGSVCAGPCVRRQVQLAAFHDDYAQIRAAQAAALALPRTADAVAIDLGDPTSPYNSIHPRRKQEVGRRLALAARVLQYGERGVTASGPARSR